LCEDDSGREERGWGPESCRIRELQFFLTRGFLKRWREQSIQRAPSVESVQRAEHQDRAEWQSGRVRGVKRICESGREYRMQQSGKAVMRYWRVSDGESGKNL